MSAMIKVSNLGKRYMIAHNQPRRSRYRRFSEDLAEAVTWPVRRLRAGRNGHVAGRTATDEFWALRDVDFDVQPGQVVGIIGRNGAGKSTLLKLLSRITEPTTGRIELNGRVASLLEVGTGFHPELTGRENIFLNGAILGMTRAEIKRKFDEIVAFAEVEQFLDTPVKRYSSGMYVRLAFAVAAHLEPEILVVDEVLAVGDADFQKKCLGKMTAVARGGRTILFVSHNLAAVQALCQTGFRLQRGRLVSRGAVAEQVAAYQTELSTTRNESVARPLGDDLYLETMSVSPEAVRSGDSLRVALAVRATRDTLVMGFSALVYNAWDVRVAIVDFRRADGPYRLSAGQTLSLESTIEELRLVEGEISLGLYVQSGGTNANVLNLCRVEVLPAATSNGVVPYKAVYRGYVELPHTMDAVTIR